MRTSNGSVIRVEDQPEQPLRCPADMSWLKQQLATHSLKAYKASVSVHDPKSRKLANEVADWCKGDELKLWSSIDHGYVESLTVGKSQKLRSAPTRMIVDR